jgi:hypothetical protein
VIKGVARGEALARSAKLQARAREVHYKRGHSLARIDQLQRDGSALGHATAARHRAHREKRAKALGYRTWRTAAGPPESRSGSPSLVRPLLGVRCR